MVAVSLVEGWGEEPTGRLVRSVAGTDATMIDTEFGACHVGSFGIAVLPGRRGGRFDPSEAVNSLRPAIERIGTLVKSLRDIETELASSETDRSDARCRGTLRMHLRAVGGYHIGRTGAAPTADLLAVTAEVERRLDLEDRIRGVGQLLEHLNDDRERSLAAQLNRIVLLVGAFGVIEATGIIAERWSPGLGWNLLLLSFWLVLIAGCIMSLFVRPLRFLKRMLVRVGLARIADTFLDDVELELDRDPAKSDASGPGGPNSQGRPT